MSAFWLVIFGYLCVVILAATGLTRHNRQKQDSYARTDAFSVGVEAVFWPVWLPFYIVGQIGEALR